MIVKFDNYFLGAKVVLLALSTGVADRMKCSNLPFMYLEDHTITFFPDEQQLLISDECKNKIQECRNYDVFTINESGLAYKFYDNESNDNVIMITPHCNSNCIMCPSSDYVRKNRISESIDEILQVVKIIPSDAEHITITGGEPFLAGERIFEILAILKERLHHTSFLFLTNGRALAYQPFFKQFHKTVPLNTVTGIPLHGSSAYLHDKITRSEGGFNQTIKGLRNLIQHGHSTEIRLVISKLNQNDITNIARLIISEFPMVTSVKVMGLEMTGSAAVNREKIWIPYRDAFESSREAIDLLVRSSINVGLYNFPLCAVDRSYHHISFKSITDYKVRFAKECNECLLRDACGGIFNGSFKLASKDIQPVK